MRVNCCVRSQRGGLERLLLLNRAIDPYLFVQMEAWHAALEGYQVLMKALMGRGADTDVHQRRGAVSPYRDDERLPQNVFCPSQLWWVCCLAQRHLGPPTFPPWLGGGAWSRVTSRSADAEFHPPHPSCGRGDAFSVLNR